MKVRDLVHTLIQVSEKAAILARTVRREGTLFQLLVEEKSVLEKNQVFVRDFKTLTDVLVQELVRHDVMKRFPELDSEVIHGEESNQFTNTLGESVIIAVKDTQDMTKDLIARVLDDNQSAASLLAEVVHQDLDQPMGAELANLDQEIATDEVNVWIDPIDSTFQYIRGKDGESDTGHTTPIYTDGLQCVSVLIGVYDGQGAPIVGVINQPFWAKNGDSWTGRCVWGIAYKSLNLLSSNLTLNNDVTAKSDDVIVMSSSDTDVIKDKMSRNFSVHFAAGAGYKLLCIIDHLSCAFVQSLGVSYRWDTCAPHAILRASHGGIVSFHESISHTSHLTTESQFNALTQEKQDEFRQIIENNQIIYNQSSVGACADHPWQNVGGLIGYDCLENLYRILNALSN